MSLKKQGKYRFHDFEVDLTHRSFQRDGHAVTISPRTFDLLSYLILKPQRVITKDELMDTLWPDSQVEESNLSQHIFLLRKALTGAKSGDKLLVTIPGRGYQFVPPVSEVQEQAPDPIDSFNAQPGLPADGEAAEASEFIEPVEARESVEAMDFVKQNELDKSSNSGKSFEAMESTESASAKESFEPATSEEPPHSAHLIDQVAHIDQIAQVAPATPVDPVIPVVPVAPMERVHPARSADAPRSNLADPSAAVAVRKPARRRDPDEDDADRPRREGFFAGFSHPGPWQVALLTALVAALGFGGLIAWRSTHRIVPESLGLVLADFDNTTGNAQFDPALKTALTIDLDQSPFLRIAAGEEVRGQLPQFTAAGSQTLTPALAREACQRLRLQSAAYLTGSIRSFGRRYLVTIKALDCASGGSLATSRGIADSPDAAVAVLDRVAVDLRRQLGEPARSVSAFSKPLFADRVPSLEALKSYSDARLLRLGGKPQEAATPLQHAVEVDPQFALGFMDMGAVYSELGQREQSTAAVTRAFELRSSVDEPHRLQIVATYNDQVTGDILASIHSYKDWSDAFPRNPLPLLRLAEREIQVGKPALALEPAQRALKLNPADANVYVVLARAQMSLGQFAAANDTCHLAIDHQLDGEQIHGILLQYAFLHLDQPGIDAQIAWAKDKPAEPYMLLQQALMDFAVGKARVAEAVYADAVDALRKQGQNEAVDRALGAMPRIEADLGFTQSASALLTRISQNSATGEPGGSGDSTGGSEALTGSPADIPVGWAQAGETSRAQALLKSELGAHPTNSLWQQDFAPQVKAAISLNQQRPEDAVEDLKPAQAFDLRSFAVPMLRGHAYLAAKQPDLAEAEFQKILDRPGIEPLSHNYVLARLGLARALAQQGKTAEAGFAYKVVLQMAWKDADPDLPRLKEAKAEYLKLIGEPVKPEARPAAKPLVKVRHR